MFGFIGVVLLVTVVLTWNKLEDIQSEKDAKNDIAEMVSNGVPVNEAIGYVMNAEDK